MFIYNLTNSDKMLIMLAKNKWFIGAARGNTGTKPATMLDSSWEQIIVKALIDCEQEKGV